MIVEKLKKTLKTIGFSLLSLVQTSNATIREIYLGVSQDGKLDSEEWESALIPSDSGIIPHI
jgi:hypothetical protein